MQILGTVFLALVGLLGAYLFLVVHSEHRTQMDTRDLQHRIQIERFDRDFDKAWNGERLGDPDRAARLRALEQQQADAQARAVTERAASQAREQELQQALDRLSGASPTKGQP